ncbi:uncharacterized protein B0I36DRAFT_233025 [Microdochium trichocladiopsis]|uniref:LysM domain-containing protein n=1 Tax=Microdochium trichocladiopsis TaxID=1682393 RepID=A0A9P8YG65_9PEZI|nr:uncharacterized protein B0I36DRAFT_233025 [Microdochium trichocladiopsis]KAH7041117.1 hypothetical protein B0I36DRAFT_233025 [Microdochium trichocladiopsis]
MEACCTCAMLLSQVERYSDSSEKPLPPDHRLECCPRVICGACIRSNPRFRTYCPYCQISQTTSSLPPGLKEPPSYDAVASTSDPAAVESLAPPPYTSYPTIHRPFRNSSSPLDEKSVPLDDDVAEDTLHFLHHPDDTVSSLSLRYGVPADALRRANNLNADHLLLARRTVIIPGQYYKAGISLSPRPVEGEEEELRKAKIRRWMVSCKVHEYDLAVLYLEQADYDMDLAVEAYLADEEWERAHPLESTKRGKTAARPRGATRVPGFTRR